MSSMNKRGLGVAEAQKLLRIDEAQRIDKERKQVSMWPGTYNLKLLAEAVDKRRMFVDFEPISRSNRFIIRYDEGRKSVYIKPADKAFFPCGWFGYERLKSELIR